jgi:hypothetical protein
VVQAAAGTRYTVHHIALRSHRDYELRNMYKQTCANRTAIAAAFASQPAVKLQGPAGVAVGMLKPFSTVAIGLATATFAEQFRLLLGA